MGFPDGSVVKNPPAKVGDAGSISVLGDPLEEWMATHSSILAWKIPQEQRSLVGYSPWVAESWTGVSTSAERCSANPVLSKVQPTARTERVSSVRLHKPGESRGSLLSWPLGSLGDFHACSSFQFFLPSLSGCCSCVPVCLILLYLCLVSYRHFKNLWWRGVEYKPQQKE